MPLWLALSTIFLTTLPQEPAPAPETSRLEIPMDAIEDSEDWYGLYLAGNKVGWIRFGHALSKGEYVVRSNGQIRIKSFGFEYEMNFEETMAFAKEPPHRLRRVRTRTTMTDGSIEVVMDPDTENPLRLVGTVKERGEDEKEETREFVIEDADFVVADVLTPIFWLTEKRKVGESVTVTALSTDHLRMYRETYTVRGHRRVPLNGVDADMQEVEIHSEIDGVQGKFNVDLAGVLWSGTMVGAEFRKEPPEIAKNVKISGDLFLAGSPKLSKPLGGISTPSRRSARKSAANRA